MSKELRLLVDDPISEPGDDKLNRLKFANRVVDVIRGLPAKESSTVLALIGPWGSGKSSLLRWVEKDLSVKDSSQQQWEVVVFNPWEISSLDGLMVAFFEAIFKAIPNVRKLGVVRKSLQTYAAKLLSLGGAWAATGSGSPVLAGGSWWLPNLGKLAEGLSKEAGGNKFSTFSCCSNELSGEERGWTRKHR